MSAAPANSGGFQISSWSIRNPIPTLVFFIVMTIVGILGFQSIRVNNWPDIDFPIVVVTVVRSGAAPDECVEQIDIGGPTLVRAVIPPAAYVPR